MGLGPRKDGESWCAIFEAFLEEAGFYHVEKHVDSSVWTGVSRIRIYILFAADYVGGQKAVDYMSETWDIVYNSRSSEEQVVNNAVLAAVTGDNYEDFVQATKEGPINAQTGFLPTSLTPHPPKLIKGSPTRRLHTSQSPKPEKC